MKLPPSLFAFLALPLSLGFAAEKRVASPDEKVAVIVSDEGGLRYRIEVDGKPLVNESPLGLEFQSGIALGPKAVIRDATVSKHRGSWENRFGNRRIVPDNYSELTLTLDESGEPKRTFQLLVRAYDNGAAVRYVLPKESGLGEFVLTNELTEFRFGADTPCLVGSPSACAENQYPSTLLRDIRPGQQRVVPLLARMPSALAVVSESDVRDWAAMFLVSSADGAGVRASLPDRVDKRGKVLSQVPRSSPWRVVMIGRTAADLVGNELVDTLASPSVIGDDSWVKPGASAWDSWWTGMNPHDPGDHRGVDARGTTESHKEYIAFAAEMGWPYQLMDWFWYKNMTSYNLTLHSKPKPELADFTQTVPGIDVPGIMSFAKSKNVKLWIWAHSLDVETFGVEKTLAHLKQLGFVGVKIDFFNNQSQETVQWTERMLAIAARMNLMIDLHGFYHPTGLARTYPNFLTQEGVLGEEYSKFSRSVTPAHQLSLVFTRGLIGPMDYTPGGFLNRWPSESRPASPTLVQGSRARSLALPVLYLSPLTVFCDNPANYRGQPGLEFFRSFPTVWDETTALSAKLDDHVAIARKSGDSWRIGAINRDAATDLDLKLDFLGQGEWQLSSWSDPTEAGAAATAVEENTKTVKAGDTVKVHLSASGGYAALLTPKP